MITLVLNRLSHPASLFVLFCLAVLLSGFYTLPASLLLSLAAPDKVTYRSAEGSLWRGRFEGVSFQGRYFDRLEHDLDMKSLFLAAPYGRVILTGPGATIRATLAGEKDAGTWAASKIDVVADIPLSTGNVTQKAIFNLEGRDLTFDSEGGCRAGKLKIRLRLEGGLVAALASDGILLTGDGVCQAGAIRATLASEDALIILTLEVSVKTSVVSGEIRLAKGAALPQNGTLTNLLIQYGFREGPDHWRAEIH